MCFKDKYEALIYLLRNVDLLCIFSYSRYATVSTTNNNTLIGNTRVQIPTSGQVTFADIGLSDIGSGIILQFGIETQPPSSYHTLTANSDAIEVKGRQYYLVVSQEVAADLALPFSLVVEIRDVGTGLIALPWTSSMTLAVVLSVNPTGASFTGTHNVNVVDAIGNFTDLMINQLGNGYTVQVTSSGGQQVKKTSFIHLSSTCKLLLHIYESVAELVI